MRLKIVKIIVLFSSFYFFVTAFWTLFILLNSLYNNVFTDLTGAITLIVSLGIVLLTLVTNFDILKQKGQIKNRSILINLILCLIQSFSFFSSVFSCKYTQGLEWVGFVHLNTSTWKFDYGAFFIGYHFELVFTWAPANGIMIGTNFITLILSCFYTYLFMKEKGRI